MSDPQNPPPKPLAVVDPQLRQHAMAVLKVGAVVQYTEFISGDRPSDHDRPPTVRAALVIFILDDGKERLPVLRVYIPNRPLLPGMPEKGLIMPGSGLHDQEVYGPRFDPNPAAMNTWRPVP